LIFTGISKRVLFVLQAYGLGYLMHHAQGKSAKSVRSCGAAYEPPADGTYCVQWR
jgi:hypothetical protein